MNRAELRAMIISLCNRADKGSAINDLINFGLIEVGRMHQWQSLWTEGDYTVAQGTTSLALPSGSSLVEARVIDGALSVPLEVRSKLWAVERWPNISAISHGKPSVIYEENGYIYFYPIPSASYTIRVTSRLKTAPAFTNDVTDNPLEGTDYLLVCWVLAELYDGLELYDKSQGWRAKFQFYLANAIGSDMRTMNKYTIGELRPGVTNEAAYLDPFNKGGNP